MSKIKVDEITNKLDDGPVYFPRGVTGDASKMTLRPGVETFTPNQLATDVALDSNIQIGFNQDMTFSGVGTITIRQDSVSGTVFEEFTCGVSAGATITGNVLTIIPTTDFATDTTYFISLPSAGIANTLGGFISSLSNYQFTTVPPAYSASGGDYSFTVFDAASPTNYYKYHIFTNPGILTSNSPSASDANFYMMMVGGGGAGGSSTYAGGPFPPLATRTSTGGGGGGGVITFPGIDANLTTGDATITVGGGGQSHTVYGSPSPYDNSTPTGQQGQNTVLSTPTFTYTAVGGGCGGTNQPIQVSSNPATSSDPRYGTDPEFYYKGSPGGSGGGGAAGGPPLPVADTPGGLRVPTQGNPGGLSDTDTNPTNLSLSLYSLAGGGGGAGSPGGNAVNYPWGNPPNKRGGKHGSGGPGVSVPQFPLTNILPRIPFGPTIAFRAPGASYGGGGAGGGQGGGTDPSSPTAGSNFGGSGGGGDPSPWTSIEPWGIGGGGVPFNPRGYPQDGCQMLGGGGAGGDSSTDNVSSPVADQSNKAGNGGPGCVMVRYAHPGP